MPTLGWLMLLLCAMGALWMPVSGFWLCLPPGIALLRRKQVVKTCQNCLKPNKSMRKQLLVL
jgi:hypothetical protein